MYSCSGVGWRDLDVASRLEPVILGVMILGIFMTFAGIGLYLFRLLKNFGIGWELKLATLGLLLFLFTLTVSKILSRL